MTATSVDIGTLIVHSSETCGDRPRIAGTRITVGQLATLWKSGMGAEEIAGEFPHLSLAQVYTALAYYHVNREEIEEILAKDDIAYEEAMALHYSQKINE